MLGDLSAKVLLQKIRDKEVSSAEVAGHFIQAIEHANPALNAVVVRRFDKAMEEARNADRKVLNGEVLGPLHGLPFTIKECIDMAGTPSTFGVRRRLSDIRTETDPYVARLVQEGGIVLGKTNVSQMLLFYESSNPVYGATNNPFNHEFSSGGSSGGEAAIIAAGGSPVGIGTDIGGSLRIPAAFCGIYSIKPTAARTTDVSRYVEPMRQLAIKSVTGVMGRFTEDLELVLNIMNRQAVLDRPEVPELKPLHSVDTAKLRVGYFLSDGLFEAMPAVQRAVRVAADALRSRGVDVVEWAPPSLPLAEELFFKILSADDAFLFTENLGDEKPMPQAAGMLTLAKATPAFRKILSVLTNTLGQKSVHRLIPYFGGKGQSFVAAVGQEVIGYRDNFERQMKNAGIDAVISPVCAVPGLLHESAGKIGLGGIYAALYNVLGFPAGVAPVSRVSEEEAVGRPGGADQAIQTAARIESRSAGLPLGVQIAAKPWDEHIVLAVMNEIQSAIPKT